MNHHRAAGPTEVGDHERARTVGPPLPHEHGAWVILYVPLVIALAVARPFRPLPALFIFLAVSGAYLSRHAGGLLLRGRQKPGAGAWLALYAGLTGLGAAPLLLVYGRLPLLALGAAAAAAFAGHSALASFPGRRRLDRSIWGELLAVAALTLSAPAAYLSATGRLDATAWLLWLCCTLFFSSAVFNVKMLLAAAKAKQGLTRTMRARVSGVNATYHLLLLVMVASIAARCGGERGLLVAIAYVPILIRAAVSTLRLSNRLPPLKLVGVLETAFSVWFSCFIAAALWPGA